MRSALPLLMPLPNTDFDPTEAAVVWKSLVARGYSVRFATPDGAPASADPIMVTGKGLGLLAGTMRADANGRAAYAALEQDTHFQHPQSYSSLQMDDFAGLILPGGHAKGMRPYLESEGLQRFVAQFILSSKPVGAICHGVLLAARSQDPTTGRSVLASRRVTGLPAWMELLAWSLTCAWMGDYYRTYPITLEKEVRSLLDNPAQFETGPKSLTRDAPDRLEAGFTVHDGNLITARWPGDAHRLGQALADLLDAHSAKTSPA